MNQSVKKKRPSWPVINDPIDLDQHVPALLMVLGNRISLHAIRKSARDLNMDLTQWRTIQVLGAMGPSQINDVAGRVAMDRGGLSRGIVGLEERGFIERRTDSTDRRRSIVALTGAGIEMHNKIALFAKAREHQLLSKLPTGQKKQLISLLHKLIEESRQMLEGGTRPD